MESNVNTTHSAVGILATNCNTVVHTGNITVQNIQNKISTSQFSLPPLTGTFRGRTDQLDKLTSLFVEKKIIKVVITGHAGIGKTELAKQFGHHMLKIGYVEEVMWFNAEDMRGYKKNEAMDVYQYYKNKMCLCIFDNVMSIWDIEEFKPEVLNNFYILITCQEKVLGYEEVILDTLPLEAALEIIKAVLTEDYNQELESQYKELAEIVSCVPLGLQVAAAYIKRRVSARNSNISNLIQFLRKGILQLTIPRMMSNPYQKSIYCVTSAMLDRMLSTTDELADILDLSKYVLCVSSFLNPDHIELSYLLKIIQGIPDKSCYTQSDLETTLCFIDSYNLVSCKNYKIYAHRLMLFNIRHYFETKYFNDIYTECYTGCIQGVTLRDIKIHHNHYILGYADANVPIVSNFYLNHGDDSTRSKISRLLVENNCCACITTIAKHVGEEFQHFINKKMLLHIGILYNHIDMVKCLLDVGCNIQHRSTVWGGETPLLLATREGNLNMIKLMVARGGDTQATDNLDELPVQAYTRRVRSTNLAEMQEALEVLQISRYWSMSTGTGRNLLHIACNRHNICLLRYFLNKFPMDVNKQDSNGDTPLHALCRSINETNEDSLDCMRLLMTHNPDLKLKNNLNKTWLDILHDKSTEFNFDINFYLSH